MADRPKVVAILLAAALAFATAGPVLASNWVEPLAAGSGAEAKAAALPAAPATPSATCVSPAASSITVTWGAVPLATSYNVLDSTTSATGPYQVVASGLAATSWSSAKLASGNYWFEVRAAIGANWVGVLSGPSLETTVMKNRSCTQP